MVLVLPVVVLQRVLSAGTIGRIILFSPIRCIRWTRAKLAVHGGCCNLRPLGEGIVVMPRSDHGRPSQLWRLLRALALCAFILGVTPRESWAQADVRNPTQPILISQTGGHAAPVQSLLFTPDSGLLLSGGLDKIVNVWALD